MLSSCWMSYASLNIRHCKMKREPVVCLVWLEWPEKCFRANASDLLYLESLLPNGSKVIRARSQKTFLSKLPDSTHVITWHFNRDWYSMAKRLQVVATPAAGRELVSSEAPKGVRVHFGGFHGEIMAESAVGFMLAWARGFFAVRKAPVGWPRTWLSDKCYSLSGTKAIIVGYGKIGRATGEKLSALGVEVYGITRHGIYNGKSKSALQQTDASSLLRVADWLVMALPSTTGTDNFLDDKVLRLLPRRCVVVNIGRGNSIDEVALVKALRHRRIAGAYLDVCKHEPTAVGKGTVGKGEIDPFAGDVPNLILMPHSCAFSPRYLKMCFKELKDERFI